MDSHHDEYQKSKVNYNKSKVLSRNKDDTETDYENLPPKSVNGSMISIGHDLKGLIKAKEKELSDMNEYRIQSLEELLHSKVIFPFI